MREIKFRGKRLDQGMWLHGDLLHIDGEPLISDPSAKIGFDKAFVDPETVGQYTGLKDRNGKEIYEGDILEESAYGIKATLEVVTEFGAFGYMYYDEFHSFVGNTNFTFCLKGTDYRFEVIGNKFDNPDLI